MSKYLSVTHFFICSQLRESSRQLKLVPFCFQGQLWGGFTSTKVFLECCLIRSTHPEVFFNEIWNVHGKVILNSYSEYFGEIPRKTATELIFNKVTSFRYALCCKWFSSNFPKKFRTACSKNTAGVTIVSSPP